MSNKVLLVDDSVIMRKIVRDIISSDNNFEVIGEAQDGEMALEKAKELKPDLIFLDIEMPKMDGLECLKRLKLVSKAKVIIVSSIAQMGSKAAMDAKSYGAVNVIAKPSGATSLDLKAKTGHEITVAAREAMGIH